MVAIRIFLLFLGQSVSRILYPQKIASSCTYESPVFARWQRYIVDRCFRYLVVSSWQYRGTLRDGTSLRTVGRAVIIHGRKDSP